jgi:hypothetical protein
MSGMDERIRAMRPRPRRLIRGLEQEDDARLVDEAVEQARLDKLYEDVLEAERRSQEEAKE